MYSVTDTHVAVQAFRARHGDSADFELTMLSLTDGLAFDGLDMEQYLEVAYTLACAVHETPGAVMVVAGDGRGWIDT